MRGAIRCQNNLLAPLVQGIEGVEELFLGIFFALNELNIIHHQDINIAIVFPEGLHTVAADRVDQVVGKALGRHIKDFGVGVDLQAIVTDSLHDVGFAKAHPTT